MSRYDPGQDSGLRFQGSGSERNNSICTQYPQHCRIVWNFLYKNFLFLPPRIRPWFGFCLDELEDPEPESQDPEQIRLRWDTDRVYRWKQKIHLNAKVFLCTVGTYSSIFFLFYFPSSSVFHFFYSLFFHCSVISFVKEILKYSFHFTCTM
jgi:hypothetical protein